MCNFLQMNITIMEGVYVLFAGISFLQNKTYHNIQMDSLFKPTNVERERVVALLSEGLESGVVTPLPTQVFQETEMEAAFQ